MKGLVCLHTEIAHTDMRIFDGDRDMFAYTFLAGVTFLLGCFGVNEVQLSRMKTREDN